MRFGVLWLIFICYVGVSADASESIFRRPGPSDIPTVSKGYAIANIADGFGDITAVDICGDGLCIADAKNNKLHRIRDRGASGRFTERFDYLIGFDGLSDVAVDKDQVFISDASGIWRSVLERAPIATKAPDPVFRMNPNTTFSAKPLALGTGGKALYVGIQTSDMGHILSIDLETNLPKIIASGPWVPLAITVSPNDVVWVAYQRQDQFFVGTLETLSLPNKSSETLQLPTDAFPHDLLFWESDLLISLGGPDPMIARAHFKFGDMQPNITPFIQGFSNPSRILGKREYWGMPAAMSSSPDGHLIFAEKFTGTLWSTTKHATPPPKLPDTKIKQAPDPLPGPIMPENPKRPDVLRGSSIGQASSIRNGSALEEDKLLKSPDLTSDKPSETDFQPD
jgi:hypothetical protein